MMKILCNEQERDAVWLHRLYVPLQHLAENYGVQYEFINDLSFISEAQLENDIFLFSRIFSASQGLKECFNILKESFKVVCDLDDFWYLPTTHPYYNKWMQENTPYLMEQHLKNADYVTTTNSRMYKEIKKLNKNCVILPNALDEQRFPKDKTPSERLRIGFTGGISHLDDVKRLGVILSNLRQKYEFNTIYAGYIEGNETSETIKNILSLDGEIVTLPLRSVFEYGEVYREIDVLVAPLSDNKFNSCKSNLKILECMHTRTQFVSDFVHPYKDFMMTSEDIETQLENILSDKHTYPAYADNDLKYINDTRFEFYQSII